jgi:hypothetical protein
MAKRKDLKQIINYVAGELFIEAMLFKQMIPGVDQEKAEALMSRIIDMQTEFVLRAGRPDAKDNKTLVKEYYRKLYVDLQTEIDAIAQEIAELNEKA